MGALLLGVTFAGCFLGAGYVSGQELWQFFGSFGINGVYALFFAISLQFAFGVILLKLAGITGIEELDRIVIQRELPAARLFLGAAEVFFMFGICVIMYAGAGALFAQLFGIPAAVGSAILCMLVALVSLFSFSGMVSAFSVFVPILVVFSLIFSVLALNKFGFPAMPTAQIGHTSFAAAAFSALTFVSYNLFCSIGILTPLSKKLRSKRVVVPGIALGCLLLLTIALSIVLALFAFPQSVTAELPMLALASELSQVAGGIYGFLLLGSMFGTALSCLVATVEFLSQKSETIKNKRRFVTLALSALGWLASLAGFGNLIGIVYPLCGYCGFGALILVLLHYISVRKGGDAA